MQKSSLNRTQIEIWFIPFDFIMIVSSSLVILLAIMFLWRIIYDRKLHTKSMIFFVNTCLCSLTAGCAMLSLGLFTYENDRKQIEYQDSLCLFRGYLAYISPGLIKYSFLIQALYRYLSVIHANQLYWKSKRFLFLLICLMWLFSLIYPFVYLFSNEIIYNVDNQVCQMPLRFSPYLIYTAICIYMMPMAMTMVIYMKLYRHVHQIGKHTRSVFSQHRLQNEVKMVRRILIINLTLLILGFPYMLFSIMSFFTSPPKYHFRIAFASIDMSFVVMMIIILQFNDPLKDSIFKNFVRRTNIIVPTFT